jgi:hypothetical protein
MPRAFSAVILAGDTPRARAMAAWLGCRVLSSLIEFTFL